MIQALKNRVRFIQESLRKTKRQSEYRKEFNPANAEAITDAFHKLYYGAYTVNKTWHNTYWLGVGIRKCPLDLWLYQEIIHRIKPDLIIETGTFLGGSAYYMASLLDTLGKGHVVTIDIEGKDTILAREENPSQPARPDHPRITYLLGSSTTTETTEKIKSMVKANDTVMVILDSDHSKAHVLKELRLYSGFVTKGSYLIVEDTNLNGHPISPTFGPGPMEAMEEFLKEDSSFAFDEKTDKFLLTFNPRGYLRKIR
jgi:cephalosporin hydroxylase